MRGEMWAILKGHHRSLDEVAVVLGRLSCIHTRIYRVRGVMAIWLAISLCRWPWHTLLLHHFKSSLFPLLPCAGRFLQRAAECWGSKIKIKSVLQQKSLCLYLPLAEGRSAEFSVTLCFSIFFYVFLLHTTFQIVNCWCNCWPNHGRNHSHNQLKMCL